MPRNRNIFLKVKDVIEKDIEEIKKAGDNGLLSEIAYCGRLGVSRVTVRRAVDELISEGRLQRIPGKGLEICSKLSANSRPLFKHLALVIRFAPDDDFFSRMVLASTQVANMRGYSYNIYNITDWRSQDIFSQIHKAEVDGVLYTYYEHETQVGNFQSIVEEGTALVMVDNIPTTGDYPCVLSNDERGGYLACSHLISKGRRNILFIADKTEEYTQKKRLEGYKRAAKKHCLPSDAIKVLKVRDVLDMKKQIECLSSDGFNYNAVASYSDGYVIEAYDIIKSMGINVPEQVALMGYGDSVAGRLLEVPLSTIEMPVFEMGKQACHMLIDYLEGGTLLHKRMLDVRLIERRSSI